MRFKIVLPFEEPLPIADAHHLDSTGDSISAFVKARRKLSFSELTIVLFGRIPWGRSAFRKSLVIGRVEVLIQFMQEALVNPDLSFCGIASLDMRGALELVSNTFEEALDRTVVALIILARY